MSKIKIHGLLILFLIVVFANTTVAAQEYEYQKDISFEVIHAKKFLNSHTVIYLTQQADSCKIEVEVSPIYNTKQIFKNMDTSFFINPSVFKECKTMIAGFSTIDIGKALLIGHDGEICTITYGISGNSVAYQFWSPDHNTKQRGLTNFLNACYAIIEAAHLQPKDVL